MSIEMNSNLIQALARCRVIDVVMANKWFEVTEEELERWTEERWLEKTEEAGKVVYTLSDDIEDYVKKEVSSVNEMYRGFILEHDRKLMEFYLSRTAEEQDSWMTRDDMTKKYMFPGTVDGAFINTKGEWEGIEVISKTAKPVTIEKAEAFLKHASIPQMNYILY